MRMSKIRFSDGKYVQVLSFLCFLRNISYFCDPLERKVVKKHRGVEQLVARPYGRS